MKIEIWWFTIFLHSVLTNILFIQESTYCFYICPIIYRERNNFFYHQKDQSNFSNNRLFLQYLLTGLYFILFNFSTVKKNSDTCVRECTTQIIRTILAKLLHFYTTWIKLIYLQSLIEINILWRVSARVFHYLFIILLLKTFDSIYWEFAVKKYTRK